MIHSNSSYLERIKISTIMFPFSDENGDHPGIMKVEIMNNLDKVKFAQQISADLDFIIYRNTTFQSTFFYKSENGTPYDLSGSVVNIVAINSKNSEQTFKINTNISEPEKGRIDIYLSTEEIAEIPDPKNDSYWNYTMTLTSKNGIIYRILQGIIKIEA